VHKQLIKHYYEVLEESSNQVERENVA